MPREETPRYGLRRLVAGLSVGIILLVGGGVPLAIVAPVPRAAAEVSPEIVRTTAAAKAALPEFGSSAVGAVGMEGVLAASGPQTPRQLASITKIVTALVVLDAKPLAAGEDGPTIVLGQRDVDILASVIAANGSWEPVQVGWKTSERAAIETMLIPSANNYAESLAIWAYGSVPKYLAAAKAYLAAKGLTGITVVDTNGLSAADRGTPADLVELGRLALASPVIATAVGKRTATEPNVGELDNTNLLLGRFGIDGLKTGTYDTGANLLFSAEVEVGERRVHLVGVILGAKDHPTLDARVIPLLKSVQRGLHDLPLATAGQSFGTYRTRWGGIGRAVAATDVSRLVWGRATLTREARIESITGGRKGERVGTVQYVVNGSPVSVPLVLDRDVLAAPIWWRLTHPIR
ncbi:D-alanyl-D-alanine carboxypeptidase family protein [uncultured Amnibacterium sp.]|uniref:D-alanyl-D-alanine carboxypeptidase family protein n=1 Tax=uncultured Amnibacterium sp. TaxID=1631851 RepID=UPI0035CBB7CA